MKDAEQNGCLTSQDMASGDEENGFEALVELDRDSGSDAGSSAGEEPGEGIEDAAGVAQPTTEAVLQDPLQAGRRRTVAPHVFSDDGASFSIT